MNDLSDGVKRVRFPRNTGVTTPSSYDPDNTFTLSGTACRIKRIRPSDGGPVRPLQSWSLPEWKRKAPLPAVEPISTTKNQPFKRSWA